MDGLIFIQKLAASDFVISVCDNTEKLMKMKFTE